MFNEANRRFQSTVGSAVYVGHVSSDVISYAVNHIARAMSKLPKVCGVTKHLPRYLVRLMYSSITHNQGLFRINYGTNMDNEPDNEKSNSSYIELLVGDSPVSFNG